MSIGYVKTWLPTIVIVLGLLVVMNPLLIPGVCAYSCALPAALAQKMAWWVWVGLFSAALFWRQNQQLDSVSMGLIETVFMFALNLIFIGPALLKTFVVF